MKLATGNRRSVKGTKVLSLSRSQIRDVAEFMDQAHAAADAGRPGMVVAQIFGDHMRVGFIPEQIALRLAADLTLVKTARSQETPE